ncbi:GyrI-like domain-containing protein [Paramicrobacterium humi]|uniref:GyrI-like domain-containing protein n=1 Tax=Paramicrobacterium humi TaxID=640635 RepID=UPI000A7F2922|nr:GyrI-like domain-containing protein [Microbacterium humi]
MFATRRDKRQWQWTMLLALPHWITGDDVRTALDTVERAKGVDVAHIVGMRHLLEGRSVQTLHIGAYDDEGPTLARLHDEYLPQNGLTFNGDHHEIYLSDPRRTPPEKLKTVLRQPVRPVIDMGASPPDQ